MSQAQRMRLLRWVRGHLDTDPSPADLAAVVGLTPDYFSRLFKRSLPISATMACSRADTSSGASADR